MFELQHWYTAMSRAEFLRNIFIVDVSLPTPTEEYAKTLIYRIISPNTELVYIGHTTKPLRTRLAGHLREFQDAARTKRCSSAKVIEKGGATIELLEAYPCESKRAAQDRERFYIERTPNCVNKNVPNGKRKREDM